MEVISYLYIVQAVFFYYVHEPKLENVVTVLAPLRIVVGRQQIVPLPVFTICIQGSALTNRKTMILTQTTQAASEKTQESLTEKLHGVI